MSGWLVHSWLLPLFAQTSGEIGPGGIAGWTSAGLLGLVVTWLLGKHIPSLVASLEVKDRQTKELIDSKDKQLEAKDTGLKNFIESRDTLIRELWAKHAEQWRAALGEIQKNEMDQRVDYQTSLQRVLEHCQRESEAIGRAILAELRGVVAELRKQHEREKERPERPERGNKS